jgi:SAM-dependent methyltransferase
VGYFDWHEEPGYYRDVTRHFAPSARILDVGCGTGWIARHFADYRGIDGSPDAVAQATGLGRNVVLGDVDEPFAVDDASFDGVIMKDLLEHVADPVAVVREARRAVRPGGLVFASSPDAQRWVWNDYTHRRPFTIRAFRQLFLDQGFEVAESGHESVMPGTSIVSKRTRDHRRPLPLRVAARARFVRRNVYIVARRPAA